MDLTSASWLVVAVAFAAANLPFANERVFGFISLKRTQAGQARTKPFWARLLELIVLYAGVGVIGWLLEGRIGNVFVQGWEFYAISACLFLVLAFPGFVFKYLLRR